MTVADVIQAIDADGLPLATLVNYAVHPEVLGSEAGVLSPDLIGPLCDRIREKGGGTGIFMNGAQGGMVTADNRGPDGKSVRAWSECVRIGQLLADEAMRIVQSAPVQKDPRLFCAAKTISFPVESPLLRAVFVGLTILTAALFAAGVYWSSVRTGHDRRGAVGATTRAVIFSAVWIAVTGLLAARGVLSFGVPPTMPNHLNNVSYPPNPYGYYQPVSYHPNYYHPYQVPAYWYGR